ncbi:hypothetical protein OIU78_018490 [Salix suchowensis]|nr:hypothetical protein OIU78_018490 [Salix suchowensis]
MQLNRLCVILPADLEEIKPFEDPKIPPPMQGGGKKDRHRGCGSQILHFLGGSLRRLHDSKWIGCFQHDKPGKHGLFYDLDGVQLPEKVGGANPRIFSYAELYIGSKGFCEDEVLGSGGFGKVYRAVLPSDGTVVAVKCLAERGEQRPENLKAAPLSWERRRNIVGGLAAALHYLHEQLETQIIHRDVKASNVMLDSSYNARLGDFGLARWLEHELGYQIRTPSIKNHQFHLTASTKIGGTIGYLPPESFQKRSVATAKSDVFSFGVVVLEVVSGRRAVDLTCPDDQIVLLDWIRGLSGEGQLLQAGDNRLRDGSFMLSDMERLIHLGLLCTLHNPQLRPNMKWVVEALSGNILGRLPPLPSFQSHPRYIAISSASNTSTSKTITTTTTTVPSSDMTVSFTSSAYVTAMEETIYETAEFENINKLSSSKSNNRSHRKNALFMVETPREISYKEIIYATNNFSDSQRVAEVDFGTAYYGILEDGHQVLVKRLGMTQCPAIRVRFSTELLNLAAKENNSVRGIFGYMSPEYLEHGEATPMADVYSYGVVVLEVVSGQMAVDFRRPEVLLVRRVHEFEAQKRPLEDLADIRLNGAYDHEELIRVVKLGIACTRSDPGLRPTMRQIVRILDGNDQWLMKRGRSTESREDWRQKNASSLSMIRSVQALGIQ